jgi:hypothetical protein
MNIKCSYICKNDIPWIYVFVLFLSEVKWSEVSYVEGLGDESIMHIRVTLYWEYLIVLWLLYLVCILYCGCFKLFCNICVCVCMCGFCKVWVV